MSAIIEDNSLIPDLMSRYDSFSKKETYAKTINAMLDADIITAEEADIMRRRKSDIYKDEKDEKDEKESVKEEIELPTKRGNNIKNNIDATKADTLLKLATEERLRKLSPRNLKNMQRVFDNIENGFFTKFANDMLNELESIKRQENIEKPINNRKSLNLIDDLRAKLKAFFAPSKTKTEYSIRQNPLFDIDNVLGNTNKSDIRDNTFGALSKAYSNLRTEINKVSEKLVEADAKLLQEVHGDSNKLSYSKAKVMAYLLQKEHESNEGGKTISAEDAIQANIDTIEDGSNKKYKKQDLKMFKKLLDEIKGLSSDDIKLSKAQLFAVNRIREVNEFYEGTARHVSSVIRGNSRLMYKDYIHHVAIRNREENNDRVTAMFNKFYSPSTKAGSVEERKGGAPLLFDPIVSTSSGTRELLTDFYMTDISKQVKMALNKAAKESKNGSAEQEIYNALNNGMNSIMETLFMQEMKSHTMLEDALQTIERLGYKTMLASIPRAAAELGSNVIYSVVANPLAMSEGMKYVNDVFDMDFRDIMEAASSGVTERVYGKKLSSKYVEAGMFANKDKLNEQGYTNEVINKMKQIHYYASGFTSKPISKFADFLISTPDKMISRTLWKGSFALEYKKNTGKSIDFKNLLDEGFVRENKEEIAKATRYADGEVVRAVTSDNLFDGVIKNQITPTDGAAMRAWKKTNSFMAKFNIYEYMTVRQGVLALMKEGDISRRKGLALIAAAHMRMASYMVLLNMTYYVFDLAVASLAGSEPPEEPELDDLLQYSVGAAATSLLTRNYGNWFKIPITYGVEEINKNWGDFMRDGAYDKYEDAIMFSIISQDDLKSGNIENLAAKMSAAYKPFITTAISMFNNVTKLNKEDITEASYEKAKEELIYRSGFEMLGNLGMIPIYKDIRRNALRNLYTSPMKPKQGESRDAYERRMGDDYDEKVYDLYKGTYHKEITAINKEQSNILKAIKLADNYELGAGFREAAEEFLGTDISNLAEEVKEAKKKYSNKEIIKAYRAFTASKSKGSFSADDIKDLLNE